MDKKSKNEHKADFMKAVFLIKQAGFFRSDGKVPSVVRRLVFEMESGGSSLFTREWT